MLFVTFGGFLIFMFIISTMVNDIDLGVIPLLFVFLALYIFMIIFANKISINNANKFEWLCDGKNTNAIKNKDFFAKKIKEKEDKTANTKESLKKSIELIADMEVIRKSM
jgi:hypothetical protein